jgi:Tfp pilus assembly PilM family ATPase
MGTSFTTVSPIGISVGTRHVACAQEERAGLRGTRWSLAAGTLWPRRETGETLGALEASELLSALDRQGFQGRQLVIGAGPGTVVSAVLDLPPRSSGAPLEQIARAEIARSRSLESGAFEMAMWDLPAPGRGTEGTHMMAMACSHEKAERLISCFDGAGEAGPTAVVGLDAMSCALARAVRPVLAARAPTNLTGIVDVGWDGVTVVVLHHGAGIPSVMYERVLPDHGLKRLYAECMRRHGLSFAVTAAALARLGLDVAGSYKRIMRDVRSRVAEHVDQVAGEVQRSLSYVASRYPALTLSEVRVSGEGAGLCGGSLDLEGTLSERLGVRCGVVSAGHVVACEGGRAESGTSSALVAALGLALHGEDEAGRWAFGQPATERKAA